MEMPHTVIESFLTLILVYVESSYTYSPWRGHVCNSLEKKKQQQIFENKMENSIFMVSLE